MKEVRKEESPENVGNNILNKNEEMRKSSNTKSPENLIRSSKKVHASFASLG